MRDFSLHERYRNKIMTAAELSSVLSTHYKTQRTVMCHGVFDVVHPGHIRHLLFAKSKADILIVSLTSDRHINKGHYRPHVPEDLRAINLAVLEFVDFVVIDFNATPIENLELIKPHLFAKGYEYSPNQKIFPKTAEEADVVKAYGGEIIFTPGDFIMSSSEYINEFPPNLKIEKLMMLMDRSNVTFDDLRNTIGQFSKKEVHVIGDIIIDTLSRCSMIGGQTKTPTLSIRLEDSLSFVGGAGIVAAHLRAAGAKVRITSIIGSDSYGKMAESKLREWKVNTHLILDSQRPTTHKNSYVVQDYRLLKVDTVDNSAISDSQLLEICNDISSSTADCIVFSDFRHGIFNKRTIPALISSIPTNKVRVADSQVASRWGNILDFPQFDLITPNEREARFSLGDQDSGIRAIASTIYQQSNCKMLIMKLGDKGIITCTNPDASSLDSYFVMDSFVSQLRDPVGAGDALLAYSTLAMLVTGNPVIASILGNLAAACECEIEGNSPITPNQILDKIDLICNEVTYNAK